MKQTCCQCDLIELEEHEREGRIRLDIFVQVQVIYLSGRTNEGFSQQLISSGTSLTLS